MIYYIYYDSNADFGYVSYLHSFIPQSLASFAF
jgi:hypothetical protein